MKFNEIQKICKFNHFSNEGLVCDHKNNLSYTTGKSWGKCDESNCPVLERKVNGTIYIDGVKLGTFISIQYS
jgi:hypothetical protein